LRAGQIQNDYNFDSGIASKLRKQMTNATTQWPDEWPTPRMPLRIGMAARLIGRHKKTIERARKAIMANEAGKGVTTDQQVLAIARLYAERGKGAVILAAEIYEALGYTQAKLKKMKLPEMEVRKTDAAKPKKPWQMTAKELKDALEKDAHRFNGPLGGTVPYTRMRAVYRELRDGHNIVVQGSIKNVPFHRALGFKSLADFLRKATGTACYPFILLAGKRRPIDLLSSSRTHRRLGELAFLTLEQWQEKMADALADERGAEYAKGEAPVIGEETKQGTPRPDGKKWRGPRP